MIPDNLLSPGTKIAVLAGAGISMDAPSNLLDGRSFICNILETVTPPDLDIEVVKELTDLPLTEHRRPGEFLRFESLMMSLADELDAGLHILDCLDQCTSPNYNHFVLAHLLKQGHVVLTTNFDRLIEIAYDMIRQTNDPVLKVIVYDKDYPLDPATEGPVLYKLHGSVSVNGKDTRDSVRATMTSVLSTEHADKKYTFFKKVLQAYDLLVVGYSGMDDFDIMPVLSDTPSAKKIIWVNHVPATGEIVTETVSVLSRRSPAQFEIDAIGRDRLWFYLDGNGALIRSETHIVMLSAHTKDIMTHLEKIYINDFYHPDIAPYEFGRKYPGNTGSYFSSWKSILNSEEYRFYYFIMQICQLKGQRKKDNEKWFAMERHILEKIQDLAKRKDAPYSLIVQELIKEFNTGKASSGNIRDELLRILPAMKEEEKGHALRLLSCCVWEIDGEHAAEAYFRKAIDHDRRLGNITSELSTLSTWRGFSHTNFVDGGYFFDPVANSRLEELVRITGYFPRLWEQEIDYYWVYMDEAQIVPIYNRVSRMLRHSIDIGDLLGEARCCILMGRLHIMDQRAHLGMEYFIRARELNTLLLNDEIRNSIDHFTGYIGPGLVSEKLEQVLIRSMWGLAKSPGDL